MDERRAHELLHAERARLERLLQDISTAGADDRLEANTSGEGGDLADPAERLTAEEGDDAVAASLRDRLAAVRRAEERVDEGTYGYSVRSGLPIPDDRLEADPTSELTVEEAREG